jgi:hypothetical protein
MVQPPVQKVPDLMPGGQQSVELLCCSTTRDHFKVEVKELGGDPNFVCQWHPLTKEERDKLVEGINMPGRKPTQIKSGYRVTVTIYEELKGKHLDMGPFQHTLVLANDLDFELKAELQGTVRGEVQVGTADDRDRIDLGYFRADDGASRTVPLDCARSGLELEVDSKEPSYLEVQPLGGGKVLPEGGKRWELTVAVPRNLPGDRLPEHSAIILKTKDKPPRRIRIPVVGHAYR